MLKILLNFFHKIKQKKEAERKRFIAEAEAEKGKNSTGFYGK